MGELITALFLGVIGMGYFIYGKRQKHLPAYIAAIGLFIAPYFTPNIYALLLVGLVLMIFPFYIDF